ncbi:MAG: DUF2341 domain-containing protein [Deltaproteobacteria bacterium]|nr:DUF2341 domain-containing protein [Deltaproteobacteria bacterium]
MKNIITRAFFIISLLLFIPFAASGEAPEWWNESWQYRQKISFDTTPSGADISENIDDFPVLLRLHSGNFNFANAKDDGTDIRLISSDGQNLLKHHIERFDPVDEIALLWVRLPRVSAKTATEYIWMYYGNESAVGGQDMNGTYAVDQVLVMHMDEVEGLPKDATAYKNNAVEFKGGLGLPSIIGTGATIASIEDGIVINNSPSMDFNAGLTFSAWVRMTDAVSEAHLFTMSGSSGEVLIGIENSMIYCSVKSDTGVIVSTEKTTAIASMKWQHLFVTVMPNSRITITLDGIESTWADMKFSMPQINSNMVVGNSIDRSKPFLGDLDEIRVSKGSRTISYIGLAHMTEGPDPKFLVVEGEEINKGRGMPVFYFATIVKNISLDGWIIIIVLVFFAIGSWFIIMNKAFQLVFIQKENKLFWESFLNNYDVLHNNIEKDNFENSSICKLYNAGCNRLNHLLDKISSGGKKLTKHEINTIRTYIDEGFVREDLRINSMLTILTMSISGGPFLGLLGTVWGVMNTFAALAEAGEANLAAIAPGVASALATTVFGLIVAIPALFGYNFLAIKIKGIIADMDIFVEQFMLKIEEKFGENK